MARVHTIGISGPSCSGKTTITRILQKILKRSVVIYQDDFFKPDSQIPIDEETQLANWDCPDALNFQALADTIQYARQHEGQLPPGYKSNEVNNTHDGSNLLPKDALNRLLRQLDVEQDDIFIIVDGFMLYWDADVTSVLDCRIFMTASYETLKNRREGRKGYATIEGYWEDPPGFFDKIVWPQFVKWNKHLFAGQDHSEIDHKAVDNVLSVNTDEISIEDMAVKVIQKLHETMEHNKSK
ncbi:P-loop containing nucleoside triphosphate hydrolase protein [Radiomyces spectabilis]|uniref:P-loop containing nucleoside triphosphate hydrolase protein n=1 Tax=Radiomyces spectabilis TaxID=64574 RepID=UPI00221E5076|nr:P-loop containing nucleoside triphosphate hydrolase protein [Radiomyces spectabilis]KAI8372857.1 P-loop containing nucleoside triphosphate hydrolase protein [Radiomyces spectabilis]